MRLATVRNPAHTFPCGEPRINQAMASRAILMFGKNQGCRFFWRRDCQVLYAMNWNDIYGRICENDASPAGVFYGLAILASDSAFLKRYISRVILRSS